MPKVSIIVPVYNKEKYLNRCLDTLINQTLKDIEIILVDDGSTDNSGFICEEWAAEDARIKVVHKKNEGLGYARNTGMCHSTGEYIGFVDSDDYIELTMYEYMYDKAIEYGVDYVRGEVFKESPSGESISKIIQFPLKEGYYDKEAILKELICPIIGKGLKESSKNYVDGSVWRALFNHSIIVENNIKFVSERDLISEDIIFNLEYLSRVNYAYCMNVQLYHYICNADSLTQEWREDRFEKIVVFFRHQVDWLKRNNLYQKCDIRIQRYLLDNCKACIKRVLFSNHLRGYSLKKKYILKMLNNEELKKVLIDFPLYQLPLKYAVMGYFMKYKMIVPMWLLKNLL